MSIDLIVSLVFGFTSVCVCTAMLWYVKYLHRRIDVLRREKMQLENRYTNLLQMVYSKAPQMMDDDD